ncbi:MAG: CidA/LrgA family protein [Huintestinicola sp.]
MKYVKQFAVILFISFAGELIHAFIPLPVPASIYGLVILLAALISGLLPLDSVKDAGSFLLEIMPMMFIPAAVGLMISWDSLKPILIPVTVITVVSTAVVMCTSGAFTQLFIRHGAKKQKGMNNETDTL